MSTSSPLSRDEMTGDEMIADQLIKGGNSNCNNNVGKRNLPKKFKLQIPIAK